MGNGMPHFAFGAAGRIFKSPFGQKSKPRTNVLFGLANFMAATIIVAGLVVFNLYDGYALPVLLVGFWLMVLMFGFGIKKFLD